MDGNIKNIVGAVALGNHEAFRTFYDTFYIKVYRFVHYFLTNKPDCENVVADVFYIVWEKRYLLKDVKNIEAYLFSICRNEAFRYIKKYKDKSLLSLDDMPVELAILPAAVEDQIIEKEMMQVYQNAINELPERCKLIFLMVREQKLSHKEIAEILSIKQGTVEIQMNIAIKKITGVVQKIYPKLFKPKK